MDGEVDVCHMGDPEVVMVCDAEDAGGGLLNDVGEVVRVEVAHRLRAEETHCLASGVIPDLDGLVDSGQSQEVLNLETDFVWIDDSCSAGESIGRAHPVFIGANNFRQDELDIVEHDNEHEDLQAFNLPEVQEHGEGVYGDGIEEGHGEREEFVLPNFPAFNSCRRRGVSEGDAFTQGNADVIVELNIGGTAYTTSESTLRRYPESMLCRMFAGSWASKRDAVGRVFIDRDGPIFRHVLNHLRGSEALPSEIYDLQLLTEEADFYQLSGLRLAAEEALEQKLDEERAKREEHKRNEERWRSQAEESQLWHVSHEAFGSFWSGIDRLPASAGRVSLIA